MEDLIRERVREVKDWPKSGVNFKDITPLIADPDIFGQIIDNMAEPYLGQKIDKIVGIDARGFLLAAPLAYKLKSGLAIVRKKGKLPCEVISKEYALEYGKNIIEMHKDSILFGNKVLVVDDVLATGGTMEATISLIRELGGEIAGIEFLIELAFLRARERFKDYRINSQIIYES